MAQRLRLASARGIAARHRGVLRWRGPAGGGPVRLQPEEQRPRPRRPGDLSCNGGKRAVARALPGEAVIEHLHVIASTLPFAHQPGSGLQLRTRAYRGRSGFLELLGNPEELALRLWAEAASGEFLHPVCDSSHQQLAAEVPGSLSFV